MESEQNSEYYKEKQRLPQNAEILRFASLSQLHEITGFPVSRLHRWMTKDSRMRSASMMRMQETLNLSPGELEALLRYWRDDNSKRREIDRQISQMIEDRHIAFSLEHFHYARLIKLETITQIKSSQYHRWFHSYQKPSRAILHLIRTLLNLSDDEIRIGFQLRQEDVFKAKDYQVLIAQRFNLQKSAYRQPIILGE